MVRRVSVILFVLVSLSAVFALTAYALPSKTPSHQIFTVTKTTDSNDGACDQDCSLREAVIAANHAPGPDQIQFEISGTFVLTIAGLNENASKTGDLDITDTVWIRGNGITNTIVSAKGIDRVFNVLGNTPIVTFSQMTMQDGSLLGTGGGLFVGSFSNVFLTETLIVSNSAFSGAGLGNRGTITMVNSTVAFNSATTGGGGIYNFGSLSVDSSTIHNNVGTFAGGMANDNGTVSVLNSTYSTNRASGSDPDFHGGGAVDQFGSDAFMVISYTTISSNTASNAARNGLWVERGRVEIGASIINNRCAVDGGSLTSNGFNLESGNSCLLNSTGDLTNTNPLLLPLLDNGGPTLTHEPSLTSSAVDMIPSSFAGCLDGIKVDQRGHERANPCDKGAYERPQAPVAIGLNSAETTPPHTGSILLATFLLLATLTVFGRQIRSKSAKTV